MKELAESIPDMSVTLETSQSERSPLKERAPRNIPDMSVTLETSHEERSELKEPPTANM